VELQGRLDELSGRGLGLAVISYDGPDVMRAFARDHGITYPLLADDGSATIRRYGILNTVVDAALGAGRDDPSVQADAKLYASAFGAREMMSGMAFPGTFILDRQKRVTARFFEDFYVERSTTADILKRLGSDDRQVAGTKVTTPHLELVTYPSDRQVAAGNRFSVVLEIAPRPGMHLYAPGATGYRVISLAVESEPFVRALPLAYPASEIYHFVPLDERVPVFQKPFTLVQELVLDGSSEAQKAYRGQDSLAISGRLEYQACDDRICYNPVTLPLTWTVGLRPLVTARPGGN